MTVELDYFVATPPDNRPGQCRINEFGWSGTLGLHKDDEVLYEEAVKLRDAYSLKIAATFLKKNGWAVNWAWVGVHGD